MIAERDASVIVLLDVDRLVRSDSVHLDSDKLGRRRYNRGIVKSLHSLVNRVRQSQQAAKSEEAKEALPFYLFVTLVLILLTIHALYFTPALRSLGKLIPFTGMMIVHGVLHWLSWRVQRSTRWIVAYLTVQGALAFGLSLLCGQLSMVGLYAALIGEAFGFLQDIRLAIVATTVYLAVGALSLLIASGQGSLPVFVLLGSTTFFVVVYSVLYSRQANARERAQTLLAELEEAHRQLAEYATRVEDLTLEAERQRMARELHDTLAQGLAGLILQLEAINAHLAKSRPQRAHEIVQQAMGRARSTLRDARLVIRDLRTEQEDTLDLAASVRSEVHSFSEATGIPCALDLDLPEVLPAAIHEHARRIVAEGLTNIARHARANQVWVRVVGESIDGEQQVQIVIRDDGIGFDPAQTVERADHYGLIGIRERARLLGGTFEIESAAGRGTVLRLTLPQETASPPKPSEGA
jgi:NarL family two-component system sensor histidine kinase YdfH